VIASLLVLPTSVFTLTPPTVAYFWRSQVARHGSVIVSSPNGELESFDYLKIKRGVFARDYSVILEGCPCQACSRGYSKAYLYHLIKAKEPLAAMLLSEHNLAQMNRYMDLTRQAILRGEI
jgi:queuine tRNA-ribosyltransferase